MTHARTFLALLALGLLTASCSDGSHRSRYQRTDHPARSDHSSNRRHPSHEHAHGAHPHPGGGHHHHPHPHPHLDGVKGHHHPY